MREGARLLARPHRRVDPALVEKTFCDPRHFRRETVVSAKHNVPRVVPGIGLRRDMRQRRVAVPMFERGLAEPFGLEPVIAMRQARIGGAHGANQRIDHLALHAVGKMPCVRDVPENRASGRKSPCPSPKYW